MRRNAERGERLLVMFTKETFHVLGVEKKSPGGYWPLISVFKSASRGRRLSQRSRVFTKGDTSIR